MITIIAKRYVKADKIEEFKTLACDLVAASQNEDGCISYGLYQDMQNPQILTFIEIWRNQAAIDAHNSSSHFNDIVPQMAHLLEEKAPVELYTRVI